MFLDDAVPPSRICCCFSNWYNNYFWCTIPYINKGLHVWVVVSPFGIPIMSDFLFVPFKWSYYFLWLIYSHVYESFWFFCFAFQIMLLWYVFSTDMKFVLKLIFQKCVCTLEVFLLYLSVSNVPFRQCCYIICYLHW